MQFLSGPAAGIPHGVFNKASDGRILGVQEADIRYVHEFRPMFEDQFGRGGSCLGCQLGTLREAERGISSAFFRQEPATR